MLRSWRWVGWWGGGGGVGKVTSLASWAVHTDGKKFTGKPLLPPSAHSRRSNQAAFGSGFN